MLRPGARLADTLKIGVARGDYPESAGREEAWLAERMSLLENPGVRHEQRLANGRAIMIEERKTAGGDTIGLRVDITELKQREESFRLLFEGNPVPLVVYNPATETISAANEAAHRHFEMPAGTMLDLPAACLFEADEWAEAGAMLRTDCSEKDRFWRQRTLAGTRLESVLFTRRMTMAGEPAIIVSVFDVTERRAIEARMRTWPATMN
ncbi:MAG: PAS-domain containing protein [Croceibacterium sp.]